MPCFVLPIALMDQLYDRFWGLGYAQDAHRCFWKWYEILPQRRHIVWLMDDETRG